MNNQPLNKLSLARRKAKTIVALLAVICIGAMTIACGNKKDYTPKPRAYLRLDLPQNQYTLYENPDMPFKFEQNTIAVPVVKRSNSNEKWLDLEYIDHKGVVYLTYRKMDRPDDLKTNIDTSMLLLKEQFDYSTGMNEKIYSNPKNNVYATTFLVKGNKVASTYQFYATDSVKHFLRGSLFLNRTPNNDSLAPLLNYLQNDIIHLLETLEWAE